MTLDASGNLGIGTTSPQNDANFGGFTLNGTNGSVITLRTANANVGRIYVSGADFLNIDANGTASGTLVFRTGTSSTERARITSGGNFVVGTAALATTATDGFLYVPTCAGTPTGTPTTQTGTAPIVVDTTNNKLYFYSGGQWRDAGP